MLLRGHNHRSLRHHCPDNVILPHVAPSRAFFRNQGLRGRKLKAAEVKDASLSSIDASVQSTVESTVDEAVKVTTTDYLRSLGVEPVTVDQLFDAEHVQQWTPQLLAYFPLGCVLGAIRCSAWVAGIAADQPWFRNQSVINAYMALLGVKVVWKNDQNIPTNQRHVLVSNHTSVGDLLMLFQRPQRYIHLITNALPEPVYAAQNLPVFLQPANKGVYMQLAEQQQQQTQQPGTLHTVGPAATQNHAALGSTQSPQHSNSNSSRDASGNGIDTTCSIGQSGEAQQASIHLFPEGGMTNGAGMMRFSRGFMLFADKLPVVPVALRVKSTFPELSSHTAISSFLANLFWFSFQPWTVIEATALPPVQLQPGESKAAFVQRVQLAIAEELGCWVTDFSIQQKRQLVQKQRHKKQR